MPLEIVTIPCRTDNYAFLLHDDSGATALIDAQAGKVEAARNAATQASEALKYAKTTENETRQKLQLAYRALTGAQAELSRSEAQAAKIEAEEKT